MGETFRPIGRGEREKLKSPAQSTRILGPALPIDPDTRLGFDWVDRQLTRYTVSMIETCLLTILSKETCLLSLTERNQMVGGRLMMENNEERMRTISFFGFSIRKIIGKFTRYIVDARMLKIGCGEK